MTGLPVAKVEIAFNAGVRTAAASRTWTDVSAYAEIQEGIGIGYGRGDERAQADPNTISVVLNNTDGRFTPDLASGAYYPNVKVGRPIRVSVTPPGGSLSVRYLGYIDEWPTEWPTSTTLYAVSRVSASSRMALLGQSYALRSVIENEILALSPAAYYTMSEASGATRASDSSGGAAPSLGQLGDGPAVTWGNATGPSTDDLTAASFNGGKYLAAAGYSITPAVNGGLTISAFINSTDTGDLIYLNVGDQADGGGARVKIYQVAGSDSMTAQVFGAAGVSGTATTGVYTINDGATHHVAAVFNDTAATITLYIDGVLMESQATGGAASEPTGLTLSQVFIGRPTGPVGGLNYLTASVAHVAVFNAALTTAQVLAVATSGLTGFSGETPAARIARYAAYAGIPTAEQSLETGVSPIAHFDTTGTGVVDAMRIVEDTEGGVLFDARDGTLTFKQRNTRYTAAVGLTLDASAQEINADFAPRYDRQGLLTDVTGTLKDGTVTARTVSTAGISDYGVYTGSIELATTDVNQPQDAANWYVGRYATPQVRVPTVTVDVMTLSLALQTSILAADIGTRVQITNQPAQAATSTGDYFIEGYTESLSHQSHTITFNLSPAAAYIATFILDSAIRGVLTSDDVLAY